MSKTVVRFTERGVEEEHTFDAPEQAQCFHALKCRQKGVKKLRIEPKK